MRIGRGLLVLVLAALVGGCASAVAGTAPVPARAPAEPYAVGVRTLSLRRSADRPLPTVIWYPAAGSGDAGARARVARGRFPLVLFSHGLRGLPESYAPLASRWAAAGFVVAAPAYPRTNGRAARFDRRDVRHQPADARYVIARILALDTRAGDPLASHLDTTRIGAAGHSAGGYTTAGLFTAGHDVRLRVGIVIAGAAPLGRFAGPAAPMLFVHGDADRTVAIARGWAAYRSVPWPKAFLTVLGGDHGSYLAPGMTGQAQVYAATTDFLRWMLYDDAAAKRRLTSSGGDAAGTSFISHAL
jgi:dienelactone hydrolase